jgi:hypothetical protein
VVTWGRICRKRAPFTWSSPPNTGSIPPITGSIPPITLRSISFTNEPRSPTDEVPLVALFLAMRSQNSDQCSMCCRKELTKGPGRGRPVVGLVSASATRERVSAPCAIFSCSKAATPMPRGPLNATGDRDAQSINHCAMPSRHPVGWTTLIVGARPRSIGELRGSGGVLSLSGHWRSRGVRTGLSTPPLRISQTQLLDRLSPKVTEILEATVPDIVCSSRGVSRSIREARSFPNWHCPGRIRGGDVRSGVPGDQAVSPFDFRVNESQERRSGPVHWRATVPPLEDELSTCHSG